MGVETIAPTQEPVAAAFLRSVYKGKIIAAGGFDRDSAETILQRGDADVVAFGRFFTSNPDLPERFRLGVPLTPYRREAFWGGSERDYNDFPVFGTVGSHAPELGRFLHSQQTPARVFGPGRRRLHIPEPRRRHRPKLALT